MTLPLPVQFLAAWIGVWLGRYQQELIEYQREEIRHLREQLGGRRIRFTDAQRRRLAILGHKLGGKGLREVATLATPDTILRWYRELVAQKYDGHAKRNPGRPRTGAEIVQLLVRMATENPGWGYTRLRGALQNLGHEVGRNTIKRILHEQGLDPAPTRARRYSWATFIRAHLSAIAAADFFTVEVMGLLGLARTYVFFVIDLASRKVEVAGICGQPDGPWMEQMARNLLDAVNGFLRGKRYLIVDRDPLYTREFRDALTREGTKVLLLPARSPNLNAFAERFVLSVRSECLSRMIPLGERHLRRAISEYVAHYHHERNHQGLANALPAPAAAANEDGPVHRSQRLGGLTTATAPPHDVGIVPSPYSALSSFGTGRGPSATPQFTEPTIDLYHKGDLLNGQVSGSRPLSLGADVESVAALNRPGQLWAFRVPVRVLEEWRLNGQAETWKDYDNVTGVENTEYRVLAPTSQQLNQYKVP